MKDPLSLSSLFLTFGNELASVSDKKGLLQLIAVQFTPHLTFSDILLSVVNDDKETHSVFIHHCNPARQDDGEYASLSQEKFRMDDGVYNTTMASPSPLVVDIAVTLLRPDPPRYISRWYRPAISRMIAVRLRSHNQLLGAFFFFFEKAHIGVGDLDLVQHFSYMMSPALKNILAEERIFRQQQDNEVLLSLSSDIVRVRDKDELLRLLDVRLRQLFVFDHSRIILAGKGSGNGMIEAALNADRPLVFDLDKHPSADMPEYIRQSHEEGIGEVVMTALHKEGESFGLLILFSREKGRYTPRHLDLIRTLSNQLSVAYTNVLIHEAFLEKENDQSLILSLGKDLTTTRNKADLLAGVEQSLRHIVPLDEIVIFRLNKDGEPHSPYPVHDGIYETLLQSEIPLVFDNGMREMVALPLRENNKGVGGIFIYLKEKGRLSQRSLSLLQGLCAPLAIGLANLWAYEEIERRLEEVNYYKFRLEEENLYLQEQIKTAHGFTKIIGSGSAMQKVFQLVAIIGPSDSTVLLLGETGTGKELVAKAIHDASPRKDKLMIKIDCAALPANLVESELFGHEKDSFTGTAERRIGKFELTGDGTLFLDEIGEMTLDLQVKLLRAIREKENVRIIAASKRNLWKEVEAGRFHSDLFHRLNVFSIHLPPLRDRKEDLPTLASHFISVQNQRSGKRITNISQRALESLMRYDWPGNVRELEQFIERSVLMTTGSTIKEISLPAGPDTVLSDITPDTSIKTLDELERDHILAVLKKCNHKIGGPGGAAELLRLPVTTLHSKIKKLGIKKSQE
ncbi:MAG: sigma 54-interacting transcriptional regulator [Chitinophagaceae bacterium]|nr:sigma 54-interacting transcriptional regulator [Chitinophagaceae bacterium]